MTTRNPEPVRIVVITTIADTLAAFFEKQLRILAEEGFEVHAVSSPGPVLDSLNLGPAVTRHGLAMERKPHPWRDLKSLWNMLRLIRRIRPQIVHAHTPKAGLLGMVAARMAGVPVRLYTVHGLPLETRTSAKRRILEMAERTSAFCSTGTYTISRSLRDIVIGLRLCRTSKVAILGDGSCAGVDLHRFQPSGDPARRLAFRRDRGIPETARLAIYIGRLSRDKGMEVLAQAWPAIAREVPDLHLAIAGEPDATDPVSPACLQTLQSDPRIHCLGMVRSADIPALYGAADLTILPTFREGLSQVALESGAMGVPIVSTRVCGLVDSVVDGVTGILVPARDPAALATAVVDLATDAALRTRLGSAAREYVEKRYPEERVNQLWIAEYQKLLRESLPFPEPAVQVESSGGR